MRALVHYNGTVSRVKVTAKWERKGLMMLKIAIPPRFHERFDGLAHKLVLANTVVAADTLQPLTPEQIKALPLDGGGK